MAITQHTASRASREGTHTSGLVVEYRKRLGPASGTNALPTPPKASPSPSLRVPSPSASTPLWPSPPPLPSAASPCEPPTRMPSMWSARNASRTATMRSPASPARRMSSFVSSRRQTYRNAASTSRPTISSSLSNSPTRSNTDIHWMRLVAASLRLTEILLKPACTLALCGVMSRCSSCAASRKSLRARAILPLTSSIDSLCSASVNRCICPYLQLRAPPECYKAQALG